MKAKRITKKELLEIFHKGTIAEFHAALMLADRQKRSHTKAAAKRGTQ